MEVFGFFFNLTDRIGNQKFNLKKSTTMRIYKNKLWVFFILFGLGTGVIFAQIAPYDTIPKKETKNYLLPIFGNKIRAKGYKLPNSAGLNVNYLWQKSDIVVSNVKVGFNNSEMYDVQNYINFFGTTAESNLVNVRPDFWLFPFLDVYGVFSQGRNRTNINANVVVPTADGTDMELMKFSVHPEFDVTSAGIGIMPIIGGRHWFVSFNTTFTWSDVSSMEKSVFSVVFNPRIGTHIEFNKKDMNLSLWAGGFRLALENETVGSISMRDIADFSTFQTRLENGMTALDGVHTDFQAWWDGLTPLQQANPINQKKYQLGMNVIDQASNFLNQAYSATGTIQNSTIHYTLDKRQKNKWNFMLGAQFQINRNLNVRTEYGFLGTRNHFIGGIEYRFNL